MSPPRHPRRDLPAQLPLLESGDVRRLAWTGPFQPALEARYLETLAAWRDDAPRGSAWLLVPSRLLGAHVVGAAAHHGIGADLHALTFTDLAERVLEGRGVGGGAATRPVPPAGDLLVLRHAIRETVRDDGYFAAVREARRFPAALAATLTELRTAGVGPGELARAAEGAAPATAAKLGEVARIMTLADAALRAAGFHHPTDVIWAAAAHAPVSGALGEPRLLLVYGFTDWNAAERALLRAVAGRVPTTCFVPVEAGPPFEAAADAVRWLETAGFVVEPLAGRPAAGPRALAARLFHDPATPAPEAHGVEIVAAPGEEREIREVARRLLLAAADGIPFDAMGVLLRHPDAYRPVVRDVFRAAGIPYAWGAPTRLRDTRGGRSLRLLLATRQERFARAAVMEFLAVADLREGADLPAAEWDRLAREARIVDGADDWRRGLGWLARRAASERPPGAAPDAARGETAARFPRAAVQSLGRIMGALLASLAGMTEPAPAAGLARRLGRVFRRLCRRTDEAAVVLSRLGHLQTLAPIGTPVSLDELAELVEALLDEPAEPDPTTRDGKVLVAELHQALGLPFRVLAVPGLVEQGFPAPPRADPILTDPERARLHGEVPDGRPGLTLAARRPAMERLAFRLAVASAEERLVLTYPRVDPSSGRARVPSFFLLRVAEAATGVPHDFTRLEQEFRAFTRIPLIPAPANAVEAPIDPRERLLGEAMRARAAGPSGEAACLAHLSCAARGRAVLRAREHGDRLTPWDGCLPPAAVPVLAARHRPTARPVAATPLETYAACPFRYYLAHVLEIEPAIEPTRQPALDPRDRGRLLHAVLADAFAALGTEGLLPLRPEHLATARGILERALESVEARLGVSALTPFWNGERARLLTDLQAALDVEARATALGEPWRPTAFEMTFGEGESSVSHMLPDGRTIAFHGRLDRLDLSPDGTRARVIDYKSGLAPGGPGAALAGGTALQLPIYRLGAEAVCRARGLPAEVVEAQYWYLTRRGRRRRLAFTTADWQARRADFDRALAAMLDGIAAGRFFQNPSAETCRGCDYPLACGTERERIAWAARRAADPVRQTYDTLQAIE